MRGNEIILSIPFRPMDCPGVYDDWTGNVVNGADMRSLDIGAVRAARASFRERFPDRAEEC